MSAPDRTMRIERLKIEIERAEYRIDVDAVADAVLRRLLLTAGPLGLATNGRAASTDGVLEPS